MDRITPLQRHMTMSHIKGKDTQPEIMVRRYLFSEGFRFRKNDKRYPGHPDIVLPKYRTAIFINGCFWHGHEGCKLYTIPKTNTEFWQAKILRNQQRDQRDTQTLKQQGWNVITIWECQLSKAERELTLETLTERIKCDYLLKETQKEAMKETSKEAGHV